MFHSTHYMAIYSELFIIKKILVPTVSKSSKKFDGNLSWLHMLTQGWSKNFRGF